MPIATDARSLSVPDGVPLLLRDLVHERTGLFFEAERTDALLEKLRDRALSCQCHSYLDYFYLLKYEEKGREEWLRVMDAFSVLETYFWREFSQIEALVRFVIPKWFSEHKSPLRIWSAACATGEEPYSLVIALLEAGFGDLPIEINASDASEAALARAQAGLYRDRSFRALSPELRQKYFAPVGDQWRLNASVMRRVKFHRANIVVPEEIADLAHSAVIFCRNVFIYFSPDSIRRTIAMFAKYMPDRGHLFVGSSESLLKLTSDFELQEIADAFVYVRKPRRKASP
jgi:chemotaxis protein methyltransferase CheR